jgi:rhodanese-related sulfurtransferase
VWRFFQRQVQKRLNPLSPADLYSQLAGRPEKPIIIDIRERREIEAFPYIIPGALVSANVSFSVMIPWIPPRSTVVLYASDNIPDHCNAPSVITLVSRGYVLDGGLRAWHEAGLPLESVTKYQRCSR